MESQERYWNDFDLSDKMQMGKFRDLAYFENMEFLRDPCWLHCCL